MRDQHSVFVRRIVHAVAALCVVILVGTVGYELIADWDLSDSLYMTIITISTVGLREVHDLDGPGKLFTIVLIVFGVGAFTYLLTTVHDYLVAGHFTGILEQRAMNKKIDQLAGHVIICGYGRMGAQVASEFRREHQPVVVVDRDPAKIEQAVADGYLTYVGDAESDSVLKQVGIERAARLVTVVDDDASNLMITLSARTLTEKVFIVARANKQTSESKLLNAGANRVLWPYGISGRRMAQMALRPNVVEFLEVVMHDEELELWLEEVTVAIESTLDGASIGETRLRETTGAIIVALRQRTGKMLVAPTPETRPQAGDILVALGTRDQLAALRAMMS